MNSTGPRGVQSSRGPYLPKLTLLMISNWNPSNPGQTLLGRNPRNILNQRSIMFCRGLRFSAVVLGSCLLGGCGPSAVAPESPTVAQSSDLGVPGAVVPLARPGEWIAGKIYILGIEAADAEAWACRDEDALLRTHLRAESTGLLALIKRAYMEQDTRLGPDDGLPIENWADAQVGDKQRRYDVWFKAGRYRYTYHRSYGPMKEAVVRLGPQERAHDLLSAVLTLRAWRPAPGTEARFGAVLGRWLWRTEVVYVGPDVLIRDDGPYPAVKIEGTTKKQHPDPEACDEYEFELWFSDDPARIPLRAKSGSTLGDIWLELTEYRDDHPPACQRHERIFEVE